jgi:hypothetical protein
LLPWLVRFFPNEVEADIRKSVAQRYSTVTLSMSTKDKKARLKELKAELLEADRSRCEAAWSDYAANPASGLHLPHDADARAVLGTNGPEITLPEDR